MRARPDVSEELDDEAMSVSSGREPSSSVSDRVRARRRGSRRYEEAVSEVPTGRHRWRRPGRRIRRGRLPGAGLLETIEQERDAFRCAVSARRLRGRQYARQEKGSHGSAPHQDRRSKTVQLSRIDRHRTGARSMIPRAVPTLLNASRANCSPPGVRGSDDGPNACFSLRNRRETDALREHASSKSRSDNVIASAPSPTMTGVMGLSLTPVSKPSAW